MIKMKSTLHPFFFEIIKFFLATGVLIFTKEQEWARGFLKTSALLLVSMVLYFSLTFLNKFKKPLKISLKLANEITNKEFTDYLGQGEQGDCQRTIKVEFEIIKRSSILSWLGSRLIANKNVILKFNADTKDIILLPVRTKGIDLTDFGFNLNITELVKEFLEEPETDYKRVYQFVIRKSKDAELNNDVELNINPKCEISGEKLSLIHSLVYDIGINKHKIFYYDNYMKS